MKNIKALSLSLMSIAVLLTACNQSVEKKSQQSTTTKDNQTTDVSDKKTTKDNTTIEASEADGKSYERLVVMSPDVANIVMSLGATNKIVGKDAMNKSPELADIPTVGTHRNITPEAITAVKPDLVIGSYMVQPQSTYQRLNDLGIKAVNVAPEEKVEVFAQAISRIGSYVGKSEEGKAMSEKWLSGMQPRSETKFRYLLSYDGRIVSGKNTVADELIRRAGGINATDVEGLKPLSREGWLAAKPDVIIIADHHIATVGSAEKFMARPEIADTPAGKNQKVLFWPVQEFLVYGLYSPEVVEKMNTLAQ